MRILQIKGKSGGDLLNLVKDFHYQQLSKLKVACIGFDFLTWQIFAADWLGP